MTIVITLISKHCCATASDSMITNPIKSETKEYVISWQDSKIISFANRNFFGTMAYWGIAKLFDKNGNVLFSTFDWLTRKKIESINFHHPEDYVIYITKQLNKTINHFSFANGDENKIGIGIHLSTYENIDGIYIPEMFVIRNFDGTNYTRINPKFEYFRSTYDEIQRRKKGELHEVDNKLQREKSYRQQVYDFLQEGELIIFHNGDPTSTNIAYWALITLQNVAKSNNLYKLPTDTITFRNLAKWAVTTVSNFQRDFYKPQYQKVGGKPHSVSITPNGIFESNTDEIKSR